MNASQTISDIDSLLQLTDKLMAPYSPHPVMAASVPNSPSDTLHPQPLLSQILALLHKVANAESLKMANQIIQSTGGVDLSQRVVELDSSILKSISKCLELKHVMDALIYPG
ncbi:hypothetical protein BATDEDRAFT_24113 [Batrachochytrium dendrobatidis JAM81]|uniref:Uncharacterized protein n=2 Tax=Batrachochytrium dendrobatidis TaxID=109871 RepID=F4P0E6_BATDJ|nr:uncharacterized protein BATDEDRAFT_24113 [Batrachochytrium dendrobatidis JAM81]EGF81574.1 hypothetical protein BATDEDRAFT_24113 [Batrachochytrium dendrobatidis JAM81]KAJ8325863.1 hypothetical protein O5D80_005506 [Batrachochytrium dendrobatidis]KAK5669643.1 hypothetical protein QVD99_004032 [Batrachochytrium dendrobatidis]OAJ38165.1 hypothetical protein BDEG_22118 [Batrachochytrium dendrobatidis JEL423]|eukprot:XP_006677913.1 hypothetical protein BATDEDRAFT_24113 [Batrachochytrium dendrobatidis JAM81]